MMRPAAHPRVPRRATTRLRMLLLTVGLGWAGAKATAQESPADQARTYTVRLGLTVEAFRNTNINDATAAYSVFLQRLARQKGYEARVLTEIYSEPDDYYKALTRGKDPLHLAVLLAWDYMRMELPPVAQPRWIVADDEHAGRHFVILTRRDRGWSSISDLQNRSLTWLAYANSSITRDWLDLLLREQQLPDHETFFGRITLAPKASSVILPVFFGTTDACLVDEPSFRLMCELNPQVERTLAPLASTDRLADVLILRRETDWETEDFKRIITEALSELHENPDGNQMLTLFGIRRLLPFEDDFLESARRLMDRYDSTQPIPVP